jgi:ribosomal protein S14
MSSDHSAEETRTCPSCGRTLPLSAFYTVKAERLGISRQRVHVLAQQGKLEPVRDGTLVFYTEASVQALERERDHEQA